MIEEDTYGQELAQAVTILSQAGFSAHVRGEANARFIFAESGLKAVEMSRDGDDVFIEFWSGPKESPSVRDELQDSFEIAVERATDWFNE